MTVICCCICILICYNRRKADAERKVSDIEGELSANIEMTQRSESAEPGAIDIQQTHTFEVSGGDEITPGIESECSMSEISNE